LDAAVNGALRVCQFQSKNGVFPYTTSVVAKPYKYALDLPCLHYQGVTLYYLLKTNRILGSPVVDAGISKGLCWLSAQQMGNGRFDWSRSLLGFTLYLTAAYAFAASMACALPQEDSGDQIRVQEALRMLKENSDGLLLRWERNSLAKIHSSMLSALKVTNQAEFSTPRRINLLAYRCYREIARSRYSSSSSSEAFDVLSRLFRLQTSTIEPMHNYLDMYTSAQALESLTYPLSSSFPELQ
jgi:hypothetical protein